ncbi:unnamed protein product [Rotaria magnacalcarata]|uniref:Uncharacterized protein n=2 Tax=Rotaria magnacalcarata TaxID=392030 RepID=A0A815R003_9BILA|nr:unnamed protein product [Rotaria magnacalcarata]CAF1470145.1 unnamed protein product [Rotaria magnacalcarata]CAF3805840.1 unnamed protein product [Rotaria magnacalcarata]CAF4015897.1 unnamed protein product [Rotaria magnacalcarata]
MSEKAVTQQVLPYLTRALQEEDSSIRVVACKALGNIGEKAATAEVLRSAVNWLYDQEICPFIDRVYILEWILKSDSGVKSFDSEMVDKLNLCVRKYDISFLILLSKKMVNMFVERKQKSWLLLCKCVALMKCTAITVVDRSIIIYDSDKWLVPNVSDPELIELLKKSFKSQIFELGHQHQEEVQSIENMTDSSLYMDLDDGRPENSDGHGYLVDLTNTTAKNQDHECALS